MIFLLDLIEIEACVHRSIILAFIMFVDLININDGLKRSWTMPTYLRELSGSLHHGLGHQSLLRMVFIKAFVNDLAMNFIFGYCILAAPECTREKRLECR